MKITKMSRALAVFMAVVMCFTMTSTISFAKGEPEPPAVDPQPCNLLVFGDSTSSGYKLEDFVNNQCGYNINNNFLDTTWTVDAAKNAENPNASKGKGRISENSYPWLLKKYIEQQEGVSECNLSSVCLNGMRSDELRALLDDTDEYYNRINKYEMENLKNDKSKDVGFLTDHILSFTHALHGDRGGSLDGHTTGNYEYGKNTGVKTWQYSVFSPYYSKQGTKAAIDEAQNFVNEEVKKADVIVVDTCMNNFGTYLAERIAGKAKMPGYERAFNYYKQNINDIPEVSDRIKSDVKVLKNELGGLLGDSDTAKEFVDSFIYCYADCVTNFSANIQMIREINPDAKIIAVGVYNTLDGVNLVINGQTIDFGALSAKGFDLVNAYIKGFDKNSPNYYYADLSGGVETFMMQISGCESYTELPQYLQDNIYESFKDSFMGGMIDDQTKTNLNKCSGLVNLYNGVETIIRGTGYIDSVNNLEWSHIDTILDQPDEVLGITKSENPGDPNNAAYGQAIRQQVEGSIADLQPYRAGNTKIKDSIKALVIATIDTNYKGRILDMLVSCAQFNTLDLEQLMTDLQDINAITGEIADYILDDTGTVELSDSTKSVLHIVVRFMLDSGIGQHPNEDGCRAKWNAVQEAYDKYYTAYEEVFQKALYDMAALAYIINVAREKVTDEDIAKILELIDNLDEELALIDEAMADMEELTELYDQLKTYTDEALEITNQYIKEMSDDIEKNASSETLREYAAKVKNLEDLVNNLPTKEGAKKATLEELDALEAQIEAAAGEVSEELQQEIHNLYAKFREAVDTGDYSEILADLDKVGKELLVLADFARQLPEYKAALEEYYKLVNDEIAAISDDIEQNAKSETLKEYAAKVKSLEDLIKNLPTKEGLQKVALEEIEYVEQQIEEIAGQISAELRDKIREIAEQVKEAYESGEYDDIIAQLTEVGKQLISVGSAVNDLPEFMEAVKEYQDLNNEVVASLDDRVTTLEKQMVKLTAKSIDTEIKATTSIHDGTVDVIITWNVDEDADGYRLTVDGKEVDTEEGRYVDTNAKIGVAATYELTPFVMYFGNEHNLKYDGKTVQTIKTPKVTVKKTAIIKLSKAKKGFTVKWKNAKYSSGYKIYYKAAGSKAKYKYSKDPKKFTMKVRKLKSGKYYTVKVRAYRTIDGVKYYGPWSKAKKVKTR